MVIPARPLSAMSFAPTARLRSRSVGGWITATRAAESAIPASTRSPSPRPMTTSYGSAPRTDNRWSVSHEVLPRDQYPAEKQRRRQSPGLAIGRLNLDGRDLGVERARCSMSDLSCPRTLPSSTGRGAFIRLVARVSVSTGAMQPGGLTKARASGHRALHRHRAQHTIVTDFRVGDDLVPRHGRSPRHLDEVMSLWSADLTFDHLVGVIKRDPPVNQRLPGQPWSYLHHLERPLRRHWAHLIVRLSR